MSEPLHPEVAVLNAALELPAAERAAYLDRACADDPSLRRQIESLLRSHEEADAFLLGPPPGADFRRPVLTDLPPFQHGGDRIGRYKLLEQIGEGGCGVVYMAEQEHPVRRRVALKIIKLGLETKQVIARFEAERQALAMMDHPNIAKVLDAGVTEAGRPYFVMELVRGVKITDFCGENRLSTGERLRLFIQVCLAIQHAHQKGIIHRDIKPSNILVTVDDPDGLGCPKVIDFGIAKATQGRLTDDTLFTAFEQFLGTPAYMSPEQAVMTSLDIDTRSDIYSLGVLLYELLTGRTPFDQVELLAAGLDEMRRTIREKEPLKPSTRLTQEFATSAKAKGNAPSPVPPNREDQAVVQFNGDDMTADAAEPVAMPSIGGLRGAARSPSQVKELINVLRGDLDWIVMKCLEKDAARRYATAQDLARDVQRHLDNEAVLARPPSAFYRVRKLVRRNRLGFAAGGALAAALLWVAVGSTIAAWRVAGARRAEQIERWKAENANRQLRQTVSLLELERAEDLFNVHDSAAGAAHLAAMLRRDPSNAIVADRLVSALVHRHWALPSAAPMRHAERVVMAAFSADGKRILSAGWDATARISDASTGRVLASLKHGDRLRSAHFSPSNNLIVTVAETGPARLWDAATGEARPPHLHHDDSIYWAEFSSDGQWIVTTSADRTARLWDASTGSLVRELRGHSSHVVVARFTPDGQRVATGGSHGSIRMWSANSGELLFQVEDRQQLLTALMFSPDGRLLLAACADGVARCWNASDGRPAGHAMEHAESINHAAFSPDGRLVLTCSADNTARLWDAGTGYPVGQPFVHEGGVVFGTFSPDGRTVATTSMDYATRLWSVQEGVPLCQPLRQYARVLSADFSPDGRRLVSASADWVVQVWDVRTRRTEEFQIQPEAHFKTASFSPDGKKLLTASGDGTARLWNWRTREPSGKPIALDGPLHMAAFSPDGSRFVTASVAPSTFVRDSATGAPLAGPFQHEKGLFVAFFSPDGERLVTTSADGTARLWNARTGNPITPPLMHHGDVRMARFSPNGRLVVTASDDRTARVWDAETGEPTAEPLAHLDHVKWAEFSPDGQRVVTASTDNTACIWDALTGRRLAPPLQHARIVEKAVFSPDGHWIATASLDRTARIWDAATGHALIPPMPHHHPVTQISFSPDGRRILTGCWQEGIRVWDARTGRPLTEWLETGGHVSSVVFDPSGTSLAMAGQGVRLWNIPRAPTPVPDWFPRFAEAVAGIRLDDRGTVALVARTELEQVARRLPPEDAGDYFERLARWFLADPASRAADPF